MEEQFEKMNKKGSSIPVFSVKKCTNPNAVKDQSFAFSATDFMTESEHGDFELSTGIFSVKTPGVYQFQFTGYMLSTLNQHQSFDIPPLGVRQIILSTNI